MRLKAKNVGNELTLDEYNAYQYLLYHMDCWNERVFLDMETPYEGDYATYLLNSSSFLLNDYNDTYKISTDLDADSKIILSLDNIHELFDRKHMEFTCTLYYASNLVDDGVVYESKDYSELKNYSTMESHKYPNYEEDYEKVTVPCILNELNIEIPLWDSENDKAIFEKYNSLYRWIKLNINLSRTPYIDIRNGKANEPYEILIDNINDLEHIIEYAPHDNTSTVIRLDANKTYELQKPLEISDGQNIEIRGGTGQYISVTNQNRIGNGRASIDGTFSKRIFIVRPGATLILDHLTLKNTNSTYNGVYDTGRGGAILVEALRNDKGSPKYGILKCDSCTFYNNKAVFGGAIFSYHAGLFLENCDFSDNYSTRNGGAVYYWANNVNLDFQNIEVANGCTFKLKVKVTDYRGRLVPEGEVDFYLKNGTSKTYLDTVNVYESGTNKGWAFYEYTIPSSNKETTLNFIAHYKSGAIYDSEVATNIVHVIFPVWYYALFKSNNIGTLGENVTISVKLLNSNGDTITKPAGTFTINGKTFTARQSNGYYQLVYKIDENIEDEYLPIKFSIEKSVYYNFTDLVGKLQINWNDKIIRNSVTGLFVNPIQIQKDGTSYVDGGITSSLVDQWENAGITDLFVRCSNYTTNSGTALLETVIEKTKNKDFRIHATLDTFYNTSGRDATEEWGNVNPTTLSRTQFILEEIDYLITNFDLDGICFDYCRFQGGTSSSLMKYNGNVSSNNRPKYINEALKKFADKINGRSTRIYISTTLMPEITDAYGQNYKDIGEIVDYIIPYCFKGDYEGISKNKDEWIVEFIENNIPSTIEKERILCCIQTYSNSTEITRMVKEGTPEKACRTKEDMNATISEIASTNIKGVCLSRESFISEYPSSYEKIRGV